MKKRIMTALLACCMLLSLLPGVSLATEVGTTARGTYMDGAGKNHSYEVSFDTPLSAAGGELTPGSYYLPEDITLAQALTISGGTVCLDLAGHILRGTGQDSVITVGENAALELYDSDTDAAHFYVRGEDGGWSVDEGAAEGERLSGGVVTGGKVGIGLLQNASLALFQGNICGNSGSAGINANSGNGIGGISVFGGRVSGNDCGINIMVQGTLLMTAGEISDNRGSGVEITDPWGEPTFKMLGGRIGGNGDSGVDMGNTAVFLMQDGEISGNAIRESSSGSGSVSKGGGVNVNFGRFFMSGGTISGNAAGGGGGVNVEGNSSQAGQFRMTDGKITGNHSTSRQQQNFGGGGVQVGYGVEFILDGGEISDNTAEGCGGGVFLGRNAKFTMNGGRISGNAAMRDETVWGGGGVYVYSDKLSEANSEFIFNDGEISGNHSHGVGGGVFLAGNLGEFRAHMTMNGGTIRDNRATGTEELYNNVSGCGGGVHVYNGSALSVSGGSISGNSAVNGGGGVFVGINSSFALSETAEITGNTQKDAANNVYLENTRLIAIPAPISNPERVGVSMKTPGIFTDGWSGQMTDGNAVIPPAEHFISEMAGYEVTAQTVEEVTEGALTPIAYPITYALNGGTVEPENPASYTIESASITLRNPVRAGYTFSGWTGTSLGQATKKVTIPKGSTGERSYTAVWTEDVLYATFKADGVVVDKVEFHTGDAALAEPAVPSRPHYDGVWESYDLSAATEDITVNALYTLNRDHTGSDSVSVTRPTCTGKGYTLHTCAVCGESWNSDILPALGHDYVLDRAQSLPAAPGQEGYDYYQCRRDPAHFYKVPVAAAIVTHTATFMIGEEIIGQVTFEEGALTLPEPPIPEKANYVGQWESYELEKATTDIVIHGRYIPVDPDGVSDVAVKVETEYENGVVTIDLTATAASRTIKVISQKIRPVDVVLVLDQSGSMQETLSARDRRSKRDALVDCANAFVRSLYENAVATGADHRVAVTGFAYSAYNRGEYKNTGLLATNAGKPVNYRQANYAAALLPINDGGKLNANVLSGIGAIVADGATAADLGLKMASSIFDQNPNQDQRERIVIFITDGTPTCWGEDAALVRQTAASAITEAQRIKSGQNAKIYSVGVHANADPAAAFTAAKDGVTTDRRGQFESYDFNRFLHAVSSNYPNAQSMNNLGEGNRDGGFYMGVRDTGNLENIFTNILYSTVYQLKTFDRATLRYVLPKEFTLTTEQELAMREALKEELGLTSEDIQVERKEDGSTELCFQNVRTREVYGQDGTLRYEAAVRFQISANQLSLPGGSLSVGAGSAEYGGVQLDQGSAATVTIPQNRSIVVFTIEGQPYRIMDAALGDTIIIPETELAAWEIEEGVVVTGEYAVFEAEINEELQYTVRWLVNGEETVEWYPFGAAVTPPVVPEREGYDFTGWSRDIPHTMPAYDLVCEAIYSPAHVHSYERLSQTGRCGEGVTVTYRCACGETKSEKERPREHSFTAILSDNGGTGNTVERVLCTKCGYSEEQNISFQVAYSEGWKTTVLDLNLLQNEVNVVQPKEEIEMYFYVGDDEGRSYRVTRIDPDGTETVYRTRSENGYLKFKANHFSIYVIGEQTDGVEKVTYSKALDILNGETGQRPQIPGSVGNDDDDDYRPTKPTQTPTPALVPTPAVVAVADRFTDVKPSDWFTEAVQYVCDEGMMNGVTKNAFSPNTPASRAMLVTILYRLEGEPSAAASAFSDVAGKDYYAGAVAWAASAGVVKGYEDGTFCPNEPVTREQLAVILYRYAARKGRNVASRADLSGYTDARQISPYAEEALSWAKAAGLITGADWGGLHPGGQTTRAETAAILMRFCEKFMN